MTELSTEEAAVVQRFEAAADAEESLRLRMAVAVRAACVDEDGNGWIPPASATYRIVDAAIAVLRGDS